MLVGEHHGPKINTFMFFDCKL